jgi:hypothetical protein
MLHQGPHPRPGPIPLPLRLRQRPVTMTFPLSEVSGLRRTSAEDFALPGVRRISPDTGLPPVRRSGSTLLSCPWAAVATTEGISLVRLSTPRGAFIPKNH